MTNLVLKFDYRNDDYIKMCNFLCPIEEKNTEFKCLNDDIFAFEINPSKTVF